MCVSAEIRTMPGIAKRKYAGELMRLNKRLKHPLKSLSSILPEDFSAQTIVSEFQKYYPLLWNEMLERYGNYKAKDEFLISQGKPARYKPLEPTLYIKSLPQVKLWLSSGHKAKHSEHYNENKRNENLKTLSNKQTISVIKYNERVQKNTDTLQYVEPLYIDAFIAAYHQKGITTENKVEIFNELKKYHTPTVNEFFSKLNDAERNQQVRLMAFKQVQSIGKYVKLRKNFKGTKKTYMIESCDFNMTPVDLWNRIETNNIQNKKHYNFFISHSLFDKNEVKKVIKSLNKSGYNVYCDWTSDNDFLKRDLVSEYTKMILQKRLEQSEYILFVKSKNSLSSDWVKFELEYFQELGRKIFYIDLDKSIDIRLSEFVKLDFEIDDNKLEINDITLYYVLDVI